MENNTQIAQINKEALDRIKNVLKSTSANEIKLAVIAEILGKQKRDAHTVIRSMIDSGRKIETGS